MVVEQLPELGTEKVFPEYGIFGLKGRIEKLGGVEREIANRILIVSNEWGEAKPPSSMIPFVKKHFGDVEAVKRQPIVRVSVPPLGIGTIYNGLRSKRPGSTEGDREAVDAYVEESLTSQDDPFEDPLGNTPLSPWGGRERGKFCVSAENIAKFDVQHALVIFDETHPLRFTRDEVIDYLDVACEVWEHQHEADPKRVYPFLIWQAMGKSASSLIHGHL